MHGMRVHGAIGQDCELLLNAGMQILNHLAKPNRVYQS